MALSAVDPMTHAGSRLLPCATKVTGITGSSPCETLRRLPLGGVKAGGEADARRAVALRSPGIPADHGPRPAPEALGLTGPHNSSPNPRSSSMVRSRTPASRWSPRPGWGSSGQKVIAITGAGPVEGATKTMAGRRTVTLPRRVVTELEQHRGAYPSSVLVFTSPEGNQVRAGNLRRRHWAPAVALAGLDGFTFHDMRHTAVSLWVAAGASDLEVAKWAGHSSASFTKSRYAHISGPRRGAGRRLDAFNAHPRGLPWCTSADPDVHQMCTRPDRSRAKGRPDSL